MIIEAVVHRLPDIGRTLTIMRTNEKDVISVSIHSYDDKNRIKLLANGTMTFGKDAFEWQLLAVARDLYGKKPDGLPNCEDKQLAELLLKLKQFKD